MKTFVLLALMAMVFAMPVIAAEPAGPPGFAEVLIGSYLFDTAAQVCKEVAPIGFDLIAVSTYEAIDVELGSAAPVIGFPAPSGEVALGEYLIDAMGDRLSLGARA